MSLFGNRPMGARVFWWDPLVVAGTVALTVWLAPRIGHLAVLPALVVGHFLLFCNVFRVGTQRELAWATVFLSLVGGAAALDRLHGGWIALVVSPFTLLVLWHAVRAADYHGLGASRRRGTANPP